MTGIAFLTSLLLMGFSPQTTKKPPKYRCEDVIQNIPPPPPESVFYKMRAPLRNGPDVPKHRFMYIPEGESIKISKTENGQIEYNYPPNTIFWKEFYLETGSGMFLVERRVACISDVQDPALENEYSTPWRFATSHFWPEGDEGLFSTLVIDEEKDVETLKKLIKKPDDWLPMQNLSGSKTIILRNKMGIEGRYTYPGLSLCSACHGGANALYSDHKSPEVMQSYAAHINNVRTQSYQKFLEKNLVQGGEFVYKEEVNLLDMNKVQRLAANISLILHNNCTSCHVQNSYAMAKHTNFILKPHHIYEPLELLEALSIPAMIADRSGTLPLFNIANLHESEIIYRIEGTHRRRRMPMLEGGVPDIDTNLRDLFIQWGESMQEAYPRDQLIRVQQEGLKKRSVHQTMVRDPLGRSYIGL